MSAIATPIDAAAKNVPTSGRLFFLDLSAGRILSANPDGSDLKTIVNEGRRLPDGLVLDVAAGHIYWTNMGDPKRNDGSIMRSDLNGKNMITIVPSGGTFTPKQLQLEKRSRKLYWSDREGMRVMRANLDGSEIETLVDTSSGDSRPGSDPRKWCVGIAVDTDGGKFYWTQKGGHDAGVGRILRANIQVPQAQSAENRRDIELLYDDLPEPIDLDLDPVNRTLYWTDRGDPPRGNTVNRAPMDPEAENGKEPEILFTHLMEGIGLALDLKGGRMFITDFGGSVYSANLDGSNRRTVLVAEGNLTGIAYAEVPSDIERQRCALGRALPSFPGERRGTNRRSGVGCLMLQDYMVRAKELTAEVIGIDSHIDTIQRVLVMGEDLAERKQVGHVDVPRLREGGIRAPFFALWAPVYYQGAEAVRRTLDLRDAMQSVLDKHQGQIELALTAADIERIVKAHKIAAFLTIEGGHQIDDDLAVLRMYYQLGIRSMTLTHSRNNNWADSSTDKPVHNGLTEFGKEVVREMNRLGMLVDVSHVSDKTFYDALAVTTKPVIVSHSSMRALSDVPRNVTDEMLRALANNGGVMGINFGEGFVNAKDAEVLQSAIRTETNSTSLTGKALDDHAAEDVRKLFGERVGVAATLEDVADHIDHAVNVAGIDHVGIGSDFDGISGPPNGLEDVSKLPALIAELLKRGYTECDLKKILGENHLRVIRQVTGG